MLQVKLLHPNAKAPAVATPGEDLAYDVYALEDAVLLPGKVTKVRTGIAVAAYRHAAPNGDSDHWYEPMGLLIRDRSSMAAKGIFTHGGVIDAGYRGEILVLMSLAARMKYVNVEDLPTGKFLGNYRTHEKYPDVEVTLQKGYFIKAGDKIAQMIPTPVLTGSVSVVDTLPEAARGDKGFGSSGK